MDQYIDQYGPIVLQWVTDGLVAILILIVGFWLSKRVSKAVAGLGARYQRLDTTLFRFLGNVARYVILAIVLIAVLNQFGVQTASIIALLGAAGLAIGLALQGALSNVASGVMLMVFRPFKTGDYIEAAGGEGWVEDITLFTTALKTLDRKHVILPNGQIWGQEIVNYTHHPVRGVDMTFGVSYDSDLDKTREVIEKVFADHPKILNDPAPAIGVSTLNDSSVDFRTRPFVKAEDWWAVRFSVPEAIKKALDEAGIEIPFPHRKVILFKGDE